MVRPLLGDSQAARPKFQAAVRRCRQRFLKDSAVDETEETALQALRRHCATVAAWIVRHSRPKDPARPSEPAVAVSSCRGGPWRPLQTRFGRRPEAIARATPVATIGFLP